MRYDIRLTIDYSYPALSDHGRNILRLLPSDHTRQKVTSRLLTIEPAPDERRDSVDFFGNAVSAIGWHRPIDEAHFRLRAEAERLPMAEEDRSLSLPDLAVAMAAQGLHPSSPQHFRGASPRIPFVPAIEAFARGSIPERPSAWTAVKSLGLALHDAMRFDPEATDVNTPPEQAFAARHGVCQDFAQIMICGLRSLGIPAGYVSGFLRTNPPPGQPRLEGVDAMHAWVMAWVGPDQGWVEFDPTNAQWAGQDYIAVAFGRDYADVAPVRGAIRTAGAQISRQAVDVIPQEDEV